MSGYIGNIPVPQATQTRDRFTATASQTTFATSGYTPSFLDVFLNGVHLVNGTDYTATNGSDVVLTSGAAAGDTLEVVAYSTYQVNSQNYTGGLTVDNDGATVLTVDRATSDGTIIDVQKDGASVGSIGVDGAYLTFDNSAVKLGKSETGQLLLLTATETATPRLAPVTDNAVNVGNTTTRFKDLYLSGGVYLGGTGSANYLDDYEEGSWTPTLSGFAGTPTINNAYYTKVGRLVTCTLRVALDGTTDGSQMQINGFPFVTTTSGNNIYGGFVTYTNSSYASGIYPLMDISATISKIYKASGGNFTYSDLGASKDIRLTYVYYTT